MLELSVGKNFWMAFDLRPAMSSVSEEIIFM
jgi:hypothetical protein